MKVAIIYHTFFDRSGDRLVLGGIESYIAALGALCVELGWEVLVFQTSEQPFVREIAGITVHGIPAATEEREKQKHLLFAQARKHIDLLHDILIFGADHFSVRCDSPRAILLQHGISWDLPMSLMTKRSWVSGGPGAILKRVSLVRNALKNFGNCVNRVCVDYNFLNWYRTFVNVSPNSNIFVIPNFALKIATPEMLSKRARSSKYLRVIFARRFTDYRGVRIMAEAAREILDSYSCVNFTFAGEGPEDAWLRREFADEPRVVITSYRAAESLEVHLEHDIAVVPSLGSEGTSLSLAEGMGASCAVIASNVGGMTNMVISGYNGLLISPTKKELVLALGSLLDNSEYRRGLAERGWETAGNAFTLDQWKKSWQGVLTEIARGE